MIYKDWTHSFVTYGGIKVAAKIPPYVWMYQGGKIDLDIEDEKGCSLRFKTAFLMESSSPEELAKHIETLTLTESDCKTCGYHMLNHKSEYRSSDECDACCQARLIAEWKVEDAKWIINDVQHEQQMYAKGFRWKVVAWVHAGGDDECFTVFYSEKPTIRVVQSFLKTKGSRVIDDYSISEMKARQ